MKSIILPVFTVTFLVTSTLFTILMYREYSNKLNYFGNSTNTAGVWLSENNSNVAAVEKVEKLSGKVIQLGKDSNNNLQVTITDTNNGQAEYIANLPGSIVKDTIFLMNFIDPQQGFDFKIIQPQDLFIYLKNNSFVNFEIVTKDFSGSNPFLRNLYISQ